MEWLAQNRMGKRWRHVLDVQSAHGFPADTSFHERARYLQNWEPFIFISFFWAHQDLPMYNLGTSGWLEVFRGKHIWQTLRRKLFTRNWWIGISPLALGSVVGNCLLAELYFHRKRRIWKAACIAEEENKYVYFLSFLMQIVGVSGTGRSPCYFCKSEIADILLP